MLKTLDIVNAVCAKIKVSRRNPKKAEFSKRELLHLWSYITIAPAPKLEAVESEMKRRGK